MALDQGTEFIKALELLEFQTDAAKGRNLLFVSELGKPDLPAAELFALERASMYGADAVYFRKFEDNRPAIPQIYLFDNTTNKLSQSKYAEIQRVLWSSCAIPLFIIIEKSQVLIFDSRIPVNTSFFDQIGATPIEILSFSSHVLKEYSAKFFDNGSFWEKEKATSYFLESTSAYSDLLIGLKKIRRSFIEQSSLPPKTAHKLIVLSILVKYLEERGEDGEMLFAKDFFKQFGADNFCGVLRNKGQVAKLFLKLSEHFNGRIFSWNDKSEILLLRDADLSSLANFLDADSRNNQYLLWRRYSFSHLPVELISSVYEEFLGEDKSDVVYTPHFLVNALVDESMPLSSPKENFRLIDGSCGSGIFLVAAYKRLVEWWRYSKYLKDGKLPPNPNLRTLKVLLKNNIFGVDIEEDATRLTTFSLCLALCDLLTPKQIWTELKFDDLSNENIITSDFFKYVASAKSNFDLVIGNPPFIELNKPQYDSIIESNQLTVEVKIPQNQIALLFLDQAANLLKPAGLMCLIMPSGPLLYNDTLDFRKYFFSKYYTSQILDFTHFSAILFGKASVATAAIFVQRKEPDGESSILHVTVHRTKPAREKIFFEIDHYDFHRVARDIAISDRFVWKANLLGGGRLNHLINRLSEARSLGEYLIKKRKESKWVFGDGFIKGKDDRDITPADLRKQKGGYEKASYLTNSLCFNPEDFDEDGIHRKYRLKDVYFQWKRKESLFKGPLLLIKKNIGNSSIPVVFSNSSVSFRNEVVGIHAPESDREELQHIESIIKGNQTFRFYLSVTSARSGISRSVSTLLQEDILNLPLPENEQDLKLSYAEKIIRDDVIKFSLDHLSRGENSIINKIASDTDLKNFGTVYCKSLNSVYEEDEKQFRLSTVIDAETFYSLTFIYGRQPIEEVQIRTNKKSQISLSDLVAEKTGKNLRINRIVKIYSKDKIHLVKPKQVRYWLRSIALRDADETLNDFTKAGY